MGQSTDAIIAFGINLGDERPDSWRSNPEMDFDSEYKDFDDLIAEEGGALHPTVEYNNETQPLYSEYWAKKREFEKTYPLELIYHCSDECTEYFLAIRGTEVRANRGYPKKLDVSVMFLRTFDSQITFLKDFCKRYGIEYQEPTWHLFSNWA